MVPEDVRACSGFIISRRKTEFLPSAPTDTFQLNSAGMFEEKPPSRS